MKPLLKVLFVLSFVMNVSGTLVFAEDSFMEGWKGDLFLGYNKSSGNTDNSAANAEGNLYKKFDRAEFKIKGTMAYAETNKNMDTQKWDVLSKYTVDLGTDRLWFTVAQFLAEHDYFADIDYRLIPSLGLGYHIATGEDFLWDVDGGLGYRITRYRVNTAADDEAFTALAHTYLKKRLLEKMFFSEDFIIYPVLEGGAGFTAKSETALTNPISKNMDFQVKYIVDYNSDPASDKKKKDTQIVAGLKYRF